MYRLIFRLLPLSAAGLVRYYVISRARARARFSLPSLFPASSAIRSGKKPITKCAIEYLRSVVFRLRVSLSANDSLCPRAGYLYICLPVYKNVISQWHLSADCPALSLSLCLFLFLSDDSFHAFFTLWFSIGNYECVQRRTREIVVDERFVEFAPWSTENLILDEFIVGERRLEISRG